MKINKGMVQLSDTIILIFLQKAWSCGRITGCWKGPDPVLVWERGSVCVFPQDHRQQLWVPERLTRAIQGKQSYEDMDVPVAGNAPASEN